MSETQILVLAVSDSHLWNKANPLEVSAGKYNALKNNLGRSDLRVGSGASRSSSAWELGGNAHSRAPPQTSSTRISGGGHSTLFQQALQVSLM